MTMASKKNEYQISKINPRIFDSLSHPQSAKADVLRSQWLRGRVVQRDG